jgi:hypothetical protein
MALGLAVGALAIGLWTFDIQIDVPAWMWRVAAIKLVLAASAGLIATGAVLLRYVRQSPRAGVDTLLHNAAPPALGVPPWPQTTLRRENTPDRVTRPKSPHTP